MYRKFDVNKTLNIENQLLKYKMRKYWTGRNERNFHYFLADIVEGCLLFSLK